MIENDGAGDREATAHETRVVIPGECRFLIADIKDFKLLLSGDLCEGLALSGPISKQCHGEGRPIFWNKWGI